MALLFVGFGIWLVAVAVGLIDLSSLAYSRCRTCPRVVVPSAWTVGIVGAMFLAFTVPLLAKSFARKVPLADIFGVIGWLLLCAALGRHSLFSDEPMSIRLWTGAFCLLFSLTFFAGYWVIARARRK